MLRTPSGVRLVHFDQKLIVSLPTWLSNPWSFPFLFPSLLSSVSSMETRPERSYFFVHCFNLKLFLCENHSEGTWLEDILTKSGVTHVTVPWRGHFCLFVLLNEATKGNGSNILGESFQEKQTNKWPLVLILKTWSMSLNYLSVLDSEVWVLRAPQGILMPGFTSWYTDLQDSVLRQLVIQKVEKHGLVGEPCGIKVYIQESCFVYKLLKLECKLFNLSVSPGKCCDGNHVVTFRVSYWNLYSAF